MYLCLKSELGGVCASQNNLNKDSDQPHLNKKQKKVMQEKKQIAAEMHEAAVEVDQEEQAMMVGGDSITDRKPRLPRVAKPMKTLNLPIDLSFSILREEN